MQNTKRQVLANHRFGYSVSFYCQSSTQEINEPLDLKPFIYDKRKKSILQKVEKIQRFDKKAYEINQKTQKNQTKEVIACLFAYSQLTDLLSPCNFRFHKNMHEFRNVYRSFKKVDMGIFRNFVNIKLELCNIRVQIKLMISKYFFTAKKYLKICLKVVSCCRNFFCESNRKMKVSIIQGKHTKAYATNYPHFFSRRTNNKKMKILEQIVMQGLLKTARTVIIPSL